MVVTTHIEGGPRPEESVETVNEEGAAAQREHIVNLRDAIWSLDGSENLRWLFITDDDADLQADGWRRKFSGNSSVDSMWQGTYISMRIVPDLLGMLPHLSQVRQALIQLGAGQE